MKTRRQALGAAALAAGAMALRPEQSLAKGEDPGLLELMVGYQQAVVFAYDVALRRGGLSADGQRALARFRAEAEQAAAALRKTLTDNGGSAPQPPVIPSGRLLRQAGAHALLLGILRAEDNATSGWYVCVQRFVEPRLIAGAAGFMAAAGRRLVTLRGLAGEALLPRAFETGTP